MNISWFEANQNPHHREPYNALLCKHGYNPIAKNGTSSSIHCSIDWTVPLRLLISHERDIEAMKWKLYIFCIQKGFSKAEYLQLESFAFINLNVKYQGVFMKADYSDFPFPPVGNSKTFASYYVTLQKMLTPELTPVRASSPIQQVDGQEETLYQGVVKMQ